VASIVWSEIFTFTATDWARTSPWTVAFENVPDNASLRLIAEGAWRPLPGLPECGPDGLPGLSWSDLVTTDCPPGALIGRFGGSTALAKGTGDQAPFPIGTMTVVKVPEKGGSLFVSINVLQRPINMTRLRLTICAPSA
jgi:hypothetical protein